ncbi:Disintegrin and metalloproteinase domain-containing protein 8 [Microtus ochrogaster]|uniref:Disintegrin and metalloproteinase domain-containing protein 8 n=1 Tax=Microtus ochrogaster TaxID=79684 RepID=A0A8J6KSU3_MICOH|nr:Disintegrin and metalloproteinase domain-containing protein 8 [Microtus ochrogaster]
MLGLWLLGALWTPAVAPGPPLPNVKEYEVVWPRRLTASRARRDLPSHWGLYPENLSYVLGTKEHMFTLHLRKNRDLLGSSYTETYSAANGSEVTEQLPGQDHCLYQGHVEGYQGSAASLSTCAGLRGFFRVGSTVHLIEPLDGDEEGQHAMYQEKHLQEKAGTCGVSDTSLDDLGPRALEIYSSRPRNWLIPREPRYVELYVVTDSQEFRKLGSREAVRQRVLEVVNHVDKLYQELDFRVVLVGLEIWSRDKFYISSHANVTLENFLNWREQNLLGQYPHDNVQLITGVDFIGNTVGLAKVSALCSWHSGAVNQDNARNPIGVASTMAHELGHNLGMNHDESIPGCYCPVPREAGGCIMTQMFGSNFPRKFSRCSQVDLESFVMKPQTGCLTNVPDVNRFVGGPVCGNQFVEHGEQCDCGTPQDCKNPCCNATSCQLVKGAECAYGACCHECKNGTPCPGGYCFDGSCPTLTQQCQDLWGPGARAASDSCFTFSISQGCRVSMYAGKMNRCGVLYCEGGQKPLERSSCSFSTHHGICHALGTDSNPDTYELVLQGTKCEEGKVCMSGRCQDLHVYRSENCSAKCNNHGLLIQLVPILDDHVAMCHTASGSLPVGVVVALVILVAAMVILAGVIYRKVQSQVQRRSVAPKPTTGLSNPLFFMRDSSLPDKRRPPGTPEVVCTNQPPRPTVTPKRPPPALRPVPPTKPLPKLKPKQVKPNVAPPTPPVKPGTGGTTPGVTQSAAGPKVALKVPVQKRKVFQKLHLCISEADIQKVVSNKPGVIESILCSLKEKMEASTAHGGPAGEAGGLSTHSHTTRTQNLNMDNSSSSEPLWDSYGENRYIPEGWTHDNHELTNLQKRAGQCLPFRDPVEGLWDHLADIQQQLEDKEQAIAILQETVKKPPEVQKRTFQGQRSASQCPVKVSAVHKWGAPGARSRTPPSSSQVLHHSSKALPDSQATKDPVPRQSGPRRPALLVVAATCKYERIASTDSLAVPFSYAYTSL